MVVGIIGMTSNKEVYQVSETIQSVSGWRWTLDSEGGCGGRFEEIIQITASLHGLLGFSITSTSTPATVRVVLQQSSGETASVAAGTSALLL